MGQNQPPSAPNLGKAYEQGIKINLKYLPQILATEMQNRNLYDPQRIQEQQNLQSQFGPRQYQQQLQALQQLDPQGVAMRSSLGQTIQDALQRGGVNPDQIAAYKKLGGLAMQGPQIDPNQLAAYNQLGQLTRGEAARGGTASPSVLNQEEQAIRSRQSANPYSGGNAQAMAEAVYVGQRGQQLQQQRLGNLANFTAMNSPTTAAKQLAFQNLSGFTNMQSPNERSIAEAGSFLSLPTPESQINQIQGVSPDRANAYVNPNAGYLGQQGALSNYQNQLGAFQAGGGATNPWMNALGGSASGAAAGASFGPYGAVIGGVAGGVGGYFSDSRLKNNIVDTGRRSPDGIPIVRFNFNNAPKCRFEGVLAQDAVKKRPDAVWTAGSFLVVDYAKIGVEFKEVHDDALVTS